MYARENGNILRMEVKDEFGVADWLISLNAIQRYLALRELCRQDGELKETRNLAVIITYDYLLPVVYSLTRSTKKYHKTSIKT